MLNKNLYNRIIESVAYTVKKSLLERDWDEINGNYADDETWDDGGESPHSGPWEGFFDLNTNEVFDIDDSPEIDPNEDEWNGLHKFVCIEVEPEDYNSYTIPSTWDSPAEGETNIYSYSVCCDPFTYTTVEYDGIYYYEGDDSTKEPFDGLTKEQEKIITDWVDNNINYSYWDFH